MVCTMGELGVGGAGGSLIVGCSTGAGFLQAIPAEPAATEVTTAVAMMRRRRRATVSRSRGGLMDDRYFEREVSTAAER
jgi:hypothetical protein